MTRSVRMSPGGLVYTVFLGALSALPPLSIDMGLPGIPSIEAELPGAAGQGALTLSLFLAGFALSPDRKSTRLNSSHSGESRMPSSA